MNSIVSFQSRSVRLLHICLRSIKPANKNFNKVMQHRSYRRMIKPDTRSSRATAEVRVHGKNLNSTMGMYTSDENDHFKVFYYFLSRFDIE